MLNAQHRNARSEIAMESSLYAERLLSAHYQMQQVYKII